MSETIETWPGRASPLGAAYDGAGTNFALFSEMAEGVELRLFEDDGTERRVGHEEVDAFCWHAYCLASPPGSATATGCTARRRLSTASAAPRQAAPRPLRQGH